MHLSFPLSALLSFSLSLFPVCVLCFTVLPVWRKEFCPGHHPPVLPARTSLLAALRASSQCSHLSLVWPESPPGRRGSPGVCPTTPGPTPCPPEWELLGSCLAVQRRVGAEVGAGSPPLLTQPLPRGCCITLGLLLIEVFFSPSPSCSQLTSPGFPSSSSPHSSCLPGVVALSPVLSPQLCVLLVLGLAAPQGSQFPLPGSEVAFPWEYFPVEQCWSIPGVD